MLLFRLKITFMMCLSTVIYAVEKPNVLLILVDDLKPAIAAMVTSMPRLPTLTGLPLAAAALTSLTAIRLSVRPHALH